MEAQEAKFNCLKTQASSKQSTSTNLTAHMSKPLWTQEEAIAFECAGECITDLIGIYSSAIANEEEGANPDPNKLAELESVIGQLAAERAQLYLSDHIRIAAIRKDFGARIRAHRRNVE